MSIAEIWAKRSTCDRRFVGCVIVNQFNQQIASGYNGSAVGQPHCSDVGHLIEDNHCVRVAHAETNALLQLASTEGGARGSTLYVNTRPCIRCSTSIVQAGILRVVFKGEYGNDFSMVANLFKAAQVGFYRYEGGEVIHDILDQESMHVTIFERNPRNRSH